MKDALVSAYVDILNELRDKHQDVPTRRDVLSNYLLNHLSSLFEQINDPGINYLVCHFRSSFLPEGRQSSFVISEKVKETVNKCVARPFCFGEDDNWAAVFLESLLSSYLYIFGRDMSFSEHMILEASRHKKNDDPVFLTILPNNTDEPPSKPEIDTHIVIPNEYFNYLTVTNILPDLLWNAVKIVLEEKNKPLQPKEGCQSLDTFYDYRKVLYKCESLARGLKYSSFEALKNRGIEVAMYFCSIADKGSDIAKAINAFYADGSNGSWPYEEDDLRLFFGIIQAACIYVPLLGNTLMVYPFTIYRFDNTPDSLPKDLMIYLGTETNKTGGKTWDELVEAHGELWNELVETHKSIFESHSAALDSMKDLYSSLVIYHDDPGKSLIEKMHNLLISIQLLSIYTGPHIVKPKSADDKLKDWLGSYIRKEVSGDGEKSVEKDYLNDIVQSLKKHLKEKYWPLISLAAADCLRGLKHEGKSIEINVAVGTEVEFREVLRPIYNIEPVINKDNADASPMETFDIMDSVGLMTFQAYLRSLIRRNYSFLGSPFRFICLKAGQDGIVAFKYIADIKEKYHRNVFSEMVKAITPLSELTLARVDATGKANIFSRHNQLKHKLVFQCSPQGEWRTGLLENDANCYENLSKIQDEFKNLCNTLDWEQFIENVFVPSIESISEDHSAGGTIVFLHDASQYIKKYFTMPEGKFRVSLKPANYLKYVDFDTFRSQLIQDGATLIDMKTQEIFSRIQLVAKTSKDESFTTLTAALNLPIRDKIHEWGTRHLSSLNFICSVSDETPDVEQRLHNHVHCFVISQDGDVHHMALAKEGISCKQLLMQ